MKDNLRSLSRKVGQSLKNKRLTIAIAESCTGGLVSSSITDISGSSKYFILGIVAYNSSQKGKLLKIPKNILSKYSAVSSKVAGLMAENIKKSQRLTSA